MGDRTGNKYIVTGSDEESEKYLDIAGKVYEWADLNIGCKDIIEVCPGFKDTGIHIMDCMFGTEQGEIVMGIEDCFNQYGDLMNGDFSKDEWRQAMEYIREFGM